MDEIDTEAAKPVFLSGDNPQIAKADGDAPVQTYRLENLLQTDLFRRIFGSA